MVGGWLTKRFKIPGCLLIGEKRETRDEGGETRDEGGETRDEGIVHRPSE